MYLTAELYIVALNYGLFRLTVIIQRNRYRLFDYRLMPAFMY